MHKCKRHFPILAVLLKVWSNNDSPRSPGHTATGRKAHKETLQLTPNANQGVLCSAWAFSVVYCVVKAAKQYRQLGRVANCGNDASLSQ